LYLLLNFLSIFPSSAPTISTFIAGILVCSMYVIFLHLEQCTQHCNESGHPP
jgi:hypothetical protein